MTTLGLVVLIAVAFGFDFTNGFHDAANAVATSITTRALRPTTALAMAALLNVVGALVSTKVAQTVGSGIIATPQGRSGLVVVFSALLGAIGWNLLTWRMGLPSSSTHALIGGLVGAAIVSAGTVKWGGLLDKVVVPMAASPVIGLTLGYLAMVAIMWTFRRARPATVNRRFRWSQSVSTGAMAYSHGTQDAQKTMGVITLVLVATGHLHGFHVPLWVILCAALAMGLGTMMGGWRIIRTVGSRITPLDPPRAFAAQSTASAVLLVSAYGYAMPVSSTHVITSSVMGVGATRRFSSVRWGVAREVILAWVLTIPGAAFSAALAYLIGAFAGPLVGQPVIVSAQTTTNEKDRGESMSDTTASEGGLARKILVGTDGSPTATVAVKKASNIAAALGAELVVVSAYSANAPGALGAGIRPDANWAATAEAAAREHINSALQLAKEAGVASVSGNAVAGDPADVVLGEAERSGVDLIVVGSKGMQSSSRFLLGSVPNKVSHHASSDLLIVHTTR